MADISPTEINWSIGVQEIFNYTNAVTDGIFSIFLLIAIYIIITMGIAKTRDFSESISIAGFITFIIAMGFYLADIINSTILLFTIAVMILGFVALWIGKKSA